MSRMSHLQKGRSRACPSGSSSSHALDAGLRDHRSPNMGPLLGAPANRTSRPLSVAVTLCRPLCHPQNCEESVIETHATSCTRQRPEHHGPAHRGQPNLSNTRTGIIRRPKEEPVSTNKEFLRALVRLPGHGRGSFACPHTLPLLGNGCQTSLGQIVIVGQIGIDGQIVIVRLS